MLMPESEIARQTPEVVVSEAAALAAEQRQQALEAEMDQA